MLSFIRDENGRTVTFEFDSGNSLIIPDILEIQIPEGGILDVSDGERIVVIPPTGLPVTFEYDVNVPPNFLSGHFPIDISNATTAEEIAIATVDALDNAGLGFRPTHLGGSTLQVGAPRGASLRLDLTNVTQSGTAGPVADRDRIVIDDQGVLTTFELEDTDLNDGVLFGNVPILFDKAFTQDDIANAISNAIGNSGVNLSPTYFGNGHLYLGGVAGQSVDTQFAPLIINSGEPGVEGATKIELPEEVKIHVPPEAASVGGVSDGQTFTIHNGQFQARFEFEDTTIGDGVNHPLNIPVPIVPLSRIDQIADEIIIAINSTPLGLNPVHLGNGDIDLGVDQTHVVYTGGSRLTTTGRFGGVGDGETFSINDATQEVVFEFDNDQITTAGNRIVLFNATSTEDDIAQAMIAQIRLAGLGLTPTYEGNGIIALNDFYNHTTDVSTSSLNISGVPQGATPIPFQPDPSFTEDLFAEQILNTIANSALVGVSTAPRGGTTYFIEGAESVSGDLDNFYVGAIEDLSGNNLVANQPSNQTHFTIVTPNVDLDFGDAPAQFPTQIDDDGARHALDSTGLALGAVVDSEPNGSPSVTADGDDTDNLSDEDGVVFGTAFNPFLVTPITVTATRLGVLDGWIDFNRDGDWLDPGEQIFANEPVVSGPNTFGVTAPLNSVSGTTYARFRLSSVGNQQPTGLAPDGEVEDYSVEIVPGEPPVANDDGPYNTNEDTELVVAADGVLLNDTDIDGDLLSVFTFDGMSALGATVSVDPDGGFRYDPRNSNQVQSLAMGATTTDTFTYRARDAVLPSNSATVTISIGGINDAPNANPIQVGATEDGGVVTANFEGDDIDSDDTRTSLTYAIQSQPAEGTVVNNNDGTFSFDPGTDFQDLAIGETRDVTFTYRATDSHNEESTDGLVTITVNGTNDAPVALDQATDAVEDGPVVTGSFAADDGDSDDTPATLTYSIASSPAEGSVANNGNGTFDFDPGADFQSLGENATRDVSFNYIARDQHGADSVLATVTVTVTGVNDAPTVATDTYSVDQDQLLTRPSSVGVLVNDFDIDVGDTITVSDLNSSGQLNGTSQQGAAVSINTNGSFVYDPRGSAQLQALGRTDSVIDTFTYTVSDGKGGEATTTVSITVQGVNNDPSAVDDLYTTTEDDILDIDAASGLLDNDSDTENDSIAVTEVQGSTTLSNRVTDRGATVSVNPDGSFSYDPTSSTELQGLNVNETLSDSFTYTIDDGNGGQDTATVQVTVSGANDAPVAVDDIAGGGRNTGLLIPILSNDSDIDGMIASLTITTPANSGQLTINNDNSVTYTPNQDFSGPDGFEYEITDDSGAVSQIATVTININDAPVAVDDLVETFVNDTIIIDVLDNDSDPDGTLQPGSVNIVTSPSNGIVSVNGDGTINYTPTTDYIGTDQFQYTVEDDDGEISNIADVDLDVKIDPFPFRNNRNALDVNADGFVSPIDALLVINFLNRNGPTTLPTNPPFTPPPFLNTTGLDEPGVVSAGDALAVINFLNANAGGEGEAEGEGEAPQQQLVYALHLSKRLPRLPTSASTRRRRLIRSSQRSQQPLSPYRSKANCLHPRWTWKVCWTTSLTTWSNRLRTATTTSPSSTCFSATASNAIRVAGCFKS